MIHENMHYSNVCRDTIILDFLYLHRHPGLPLYLMSAQLLEPDLHPTFDPYLWKPSRQQLQQQRFLPEYRQRWPVRHRKQRQQLQLHQPLRRPRLVFFVVEGG
jgi:O-glycosyl hydrolase